MLFNTTGMETLKPSNFQKVGEFHKIFGHPKKDVLQKDILTEDPKLVNFRISLIEEEFNELKNAINNNDMVEVIDGLCDLLYVIYGTGQAFGIDLDKAFDIVHKSNMSKLCHTEEEAKETIEYYKTLPGFENMNIKYRPSENGDFYIVYNSETGKILKSKYFNHPNFSSILT